MKRLQALEGLRGYAVFLVFLTHAFGLLGAKLYGIDGDHFSLWDSPSGAVAACLLLFHSHYGVDLFFVLSGLLMADIAVRRWPGARRFLERRALRIYPAYLASVAVVAVLAILWTGRPISAADAAANVAFLQGFFVLGIPAINPVTWSLSYEAAFYLGVPLLALAWSGRPQVAAGRASFGLMLAAFALVVAASALAPGAKSIYFAYFALFVPGIFLGVLEAEARQRLAQRLPTWLAVAAWIAFAAAVKLEWISNRDPHYYLASGVACGLLVLKACDEAGPLARWLTRKPALWLGHYSYSFFLIHYVVLHALGSELTWPMGATAGSTPGMAAGMVGMAHAAAYAVLLVGGGFALSLAAARVLYAIAERFYFERR
jgi:exopolysaccharide production protein ExoZ